MFMIYDTSFQILSESLVVPIKQKALSAQSSFHFKFYKPVESKNYILIGEILECQVS
jgi:hypothetical protein